MRKLWILAIFTVAISCNDKLWDEIDRLDYVNQSQANSLRQLREENALLQDLLDDTEAELTELINSGDEANAVAIHDANEDILEALQLIDTLQDNVQYNEEFIVSVRDSLSESISNVGDLIELEVEVIDSLIANNVSGLEDLQAQVDSIQPVINNYTLVSVTNITNIVEDNTPDCSEYDESEPFALPNYVRHTVRNIREYTDGCDGTGAPIFENLVFVQFGEYWRAYTEKDGWLGTFGLDENKMNIEGWPDGDKCYEHVDGPITDFDAIPGIGEIAIGELEDSDITLSYEFDGTTYTGCVNTNEDVQFYVNGEPVEGSSFDIDGVNGIYVITAITGDTILQHEIEKGTGKGTSKGKVVKKVII